MIRIDEIDAFYISYDEPQAERFWSELRALVPWAKRTHGVKGFDQAHRACAEASKTERFLTIDGDNRVDGSFFDMTLEVSEEDPSTFSWGARNHLNGLVYGNGGIKCWHRTTVMKMCSHAAGKVDFCWDEGYTQMKHAYSTTYQNGSPYQAFRAGFREGIKFLLDRGNPVPMNKFHTLWRGNLNRLEIWCSVGLDIHNGDWAMLGAREAVMETLRGFDISNISNYDWFSEYWSSIWARYGNRVEERIHETSSILRQVGLNVCLFSPEESAFFKRHAQSLPRSSRVMERE